MKKVIEKIINNENLSEDEMRKTINTIMKGEPTSCQIGGFLTALRAKGETIEEITGAVKGMRDNMLKLDMEGEFLIDTCGTGGDGGKTFNISTAVAIIAAAAGVKVAKHGNRAASSKCGAADCLEALRINLDQPPAKVVQELKEIGICFMFAQKYHASMKYVGAIRKELGIRTVFNILGPLTNPAHPKRMVLGVYDEYLLEPLAKVMLSLGVESGMVIYGQDCLDELSLSAPTSICEFKNGWFRRYEIKPEDFGFVRCKKADISGGDPKENAQVTLDILNGAKGPKTDIVLLNAGAAIYVGGKAESIKAGIEKAKELIASGAAMAKLEEFRQLSNQ